MPAYDEIGRSYARTRVADPRIAAEILSALGAASTVVNVGAGTGSYEPTDRVVVAVEPSTAMICQRPERGGPPVQGMAEALPFAARSFDAALAVLTVHHWNDLGAGLAEMRRVADRQVIATFDPARHAKCWLFADYLPSWAEDDDPLSPLPDIVERLDVDAVIDVPIPEDCTDGFGAAFWNKPERYLEADVQGGISALALSDPRRVSTAMARLEDDLASGAWDDRHGHLRELHELDLGYRLILASR